MSKRISTVGRMKQLGHLKPRYRVGRCILGRRQRRLREVFPMQKSWPATIVCLVLFVALCIPFVGVASRFEGGSEDLFDLGFQLFHLFWLLGWGLSVLAMALVCLLLLFGREIVQAGPAGVELRFEILGLGIGGLFAPERLSNLRIVADAPKDSGSAWRGQHLAFDYFEIPIAFGSELDTAACQRLQRKLQQALGADIPPVLPPDVAQLCEQVRLDAVRAESRQSKLQTSSIPNASPAQAVVLNWTSHSALLLIAVNLIPIAGVLLWRWNIGELFLLFWLESAIIGVFNVAKLLVIGRWSGLFTALFFLAHYGGFMTGHLVFIFGLFIEGPGNPSMSLPEVAQVFRSLWPAILGLFISHGFSFFDNFLRRKEYVDKSVKEQMTEPYKRIIVMQLTIIFGGFLVLALGSPVYSLLLLIVLKLVMDLRSHVREHAPRD